MSNIYIQEPPTKGKVILKTTVGEIEIELWSKECPKTCRNFIQLCMEGYYNGTIFHRILKDFIAQGGDPTGTGEGGESIYGEPFKDEFHSRLRFNRRGLLGMANSQLDDNASQFFFTLGACPELNKKHTLFGRVGGTTIYNMIKFNESELIDERPIRPEKILSAEIIYNPFEDIQPRNLRATKQVVEDKSKKQKGVKNFGLLSFGDEAEEDEEELEDVTETLKSKAKSAHDIGDPSLISKKIDGKTKNTDSSSSSSSESDDSDSDRDNEKKGASFEAIIDLESIKSKLQKKSESLKKAAMNFNTKDNEKIDEKELMRKKTQDEIKKIQKELLNKDKNDTKKKETIEEKKEEGKIVKEYKEDVEKYEHLKHRKKNEKKKEDKTLELLNSFRDRLFKAKKTTEFDSDETKATEEEDFPPKTDDDIENSEESIWTHRLEVEDEIKQKVIDANVADNDRWDIYDPRNPLNKRKREESKDILKDRKRSGAGSSRSSYSSSRSRHH